MKITEICESTTSGSVATVAAPMNGGPLKRSAVGKGVYGKEPAGSLFTGKKTNARYANSVKEGAGENLKSQTPTLGRNFEECKSCRGLGGFGPGHKCRACNGTGMVDLKTPHNGGKNNQPRNQGLPGERVTEAESDFKGEDVLVLYIDGKPTVKYADLRGEKKYIGSERKYLDITKAETDLDILKGKYPNSKFELKQEVREAGMPASVIKNKQRLSGMTDAELAEHLKDKSDEELKQMAWRHGYGKMSPHYVNRVKKGKEIKENELKETDLIIVPGQGHRLKSGFISRAEDRRDHEVEMARSDLHQAHKNSSKIHKLIKNVSEDDGLEGWVQAKITKAADYLNSVCQYLEGKQLQEMTGGVIAGGGVGEAADPIAKRITVKKWGGNDDRSWAVLVDGKPAVTGLSKREVPHHTSLVMNKLKEKPQLTGTNIEEGADFDHLEEGMGLKQLAAAAAALGYMLVPNSLGNGERSTADSAYDSYLSKTPPHLVPRYTTPTKGK